MIHNMKHSLSENVPNQLCLADKIFELFNRKKENKSNQTKLNVTTTKFAGK